MQHAMHKLNRLALHAQIQAEKSHQLSQDLHALCEAMSQLQESKHSSQPPLSRVPETQVVEDESEETNVTRVKLVGDQGARFGPFTSIKRAQRYLETINDRVKLHWEETDLDVIITPSNELDVPKDVRKLLKKGGVILGYRAFLGWLKATGGWDRDSPLDQELI